MWRWLKDPENRTVLAWLGSGLVVLAAGAWAVFTYLVPPGGGVGGGEPAGVEVKYGVGAGGDVSVGRDVNVTTPGAPGEEGE